ncbi:hypothetical protein NM208_g3626 [Fusarium decemcellulare]|uniref:Uncharacterized protein n=1 Tax=Fusarium decemcellulare TaxID=57161 RepID=A0ACC1SNK7_9HYPO|nr:hypothetical protein NM208_g3626 [Fusarium decemcellulare]
MGSLDNKLRPVDLSHHINAKSKARHPSPLKDIIKFMNYDGMISLAGGEYSELYLNQANSYKGFLIHPCFHLKGPNSTLLPLQPPFPMIPGFLQYGSGAGNRELIQLARELTNRVHSPPCEYECLLHPGNTNAWSKVVGLLCEDDDYVIVEEFTYPSAQALWIPLGIKAAPVPADAEGILATNLREMLASWDEAARGRRRPHVLYLVSVGSNPTGITISAQRRKEIYAVCVEFDLVIVEDDPYYFLQYPRYTPKTEEPTFEPKTTTEFLQSLTPSFLSMDTQGRVIRLESFSKTLFPGLRLGYFVANPLFTERLLRATEVETQDPAGLSQAFTLALFQQWGHDGYLTWLQRLQFQYQTRRDWLISAFHEQFTVVPAAKSPVPTAQGYVACVREKATSKLRPVFSFVDPEAGMFVWSKFYFERVSRFTELEVQSLDDPEQSFAQEIWQAMAAELVLLTPGSYYHAWQGADKKDQIYEGVKRALAALPIVSISVRGSVWYQAASLLVLLAVAASLVAINNEFILVANGLRSKVDDKHRYSSTPGPREPAFQSAILPCKSVLQLLLAVGALKMSVSLDAERKRDTADGTASLPSIPKRHKTTHGDDQVQRTLSPGDYTVGWICALPVEMAAAKAMLDHVHRSVPASADDTNTYTMGNLGCHNIVMACLPARQFGLNNAATVANNMLRSFPSIRFGLMVGIGGGVPGKADIRLGDVVVSDEVVQYDFGKTVRDGKFRRTRTLNKPPPSLTTAVAKLQADHASEPSRIPVILSEMLEKHPRMTLYTHRGTLQDQLFDSAYDHVESMDTCDSCSPSMLKHRSIRADMDPKIHHGVIASGNQVMKHGKTRDKLAEELNILCFEMEAAGLMDNFPCLVIRGICDYSDSHKNKQWQEYAAATAAAYAKELLSVIPPIDADVNETLNFINDRRERLLYSLSFDMIDSRRATVQVQYSNTCEWLLTHADYLDWSNPAKAGEHHGFLWIKGKPGAGKSTIMKFAATQASNDKSNTVISFFFNARGAELEKSTTGMYRALLFQLLVELPSCLEVLDPEHNSKLDALYTGLVHKRSQPEWDIQVLQELLRSSVEKLDQARLVCFIDAIDECAEAEVEGMVEYFEELGVSAGLKGAYLRICFSSRHYPHVDIQYGRELVLELQEGHEKDIATYIEKKLKVGKGKAAEGIRSTMQMKAAGVFMWAVLVVEILNSEYKSGRMFAVKKRLDTIPTKLSDLFKEILSRDQNNLRDMRLGIQWILFAERPLKLEEYYFAVVSGLSPEELGEWDQEELTTDDMGRFLLSSSKGLAEITKGNPQTVQFIHESVREFFLKDGLRELWPDLTDDFECFSHEQLKECCYTYTKLNFTVYVPSDLSALAAYSNEARYLRRSVSDRHPFLEYAIQHIFYHANAAASGVSQQEFLRAFNVEAWIKVANLFGDSEAVHIRNELLRSILISNGHFELVQFRRMGSEN